MAIYEEAYEAVSKALDDALITLTGSINPPVPTITPSGPAYRFREQSISQALVIKCVRMLSTLKALKALLGEGLLLDAGSMMRISDEVGMDIMFLAAPSLFGKPLEDRHKQYLTELFQEEFGPGDRLHSRLKRDRVSRKHIRAYVARTFSGDGDVSKVVAVTEMIEGVFSGFIHGAGAHTMDLFNGRIFTTQLPQGSPPLVHMQDQFSHYIQRTVMSFCFSAAAFRREDIFNKLYELNAKYFDDHGELRKSRTNAQSHPHS